MNYKFILSLDPSGNFNEGKGTTGWCVLNCLDDNITKAGSFSAKQFKTQEEYWAYHLELIDKYFDRYGANMLLLVEDYKLYESKAKDQINSRMETPKVIGIIQLHCFTKHIPIELQPASLVKQRWNNKILHHKQYIIQKGKGYALPNTKEKIDRHCLDSIRHAVHYNTFKNERSA